MGSVIQEWVHEISMMQQSVILTAIRGPDGMPKYSAAKKVLRWYRRCVLLSAMDGKVLSNPIDPNGGSFTGPSVDDCDDWRTPMNEIVGLYLRELDAVPHHFQLHLLHGVEIIGYKHPDPMIRGWWFQVYVRLVDDMHLYPESEKQLDERLGDSREGWLNRADPATAE